MTIKAFRVSLLPSIADFIFIVVLMHLFFTENTSMLGDCDTGYHIRAGEYMLRTHTIPKFDIFSWHSPPIPWTAHEWLSEIVMGAIHSRFGLTGVEAFFACVLALTTAALFRIVRAHGADVLMAILVTVFALTAFKTHWLARPHVFSFLFMLVYHSLLDSWRRGRFDRLNLLPPLMLLWVNLHGGFLGGFILLGAYLAGTLMGMLAAPAVDREQLRGQLKRLIVIISACLVACLANPQGYRILLFPFKLVSDTYIMDHIMEFMSPDFHQQSAFKYLLLVLIALFALSRRAMDATELVLVLIFTDMALYSSRYIALFALVTAPIVTRKASDAREQLKGSFGEFLRRRSERIAGIDARSGGHLWPVVAICLLAVAIGNGTVQHHFDRRTKAVDAADFLMKEKITGNMFDNDEIGDYLIYRTYPSYRVFFDGRSDMYGPAVMKEYYQVIRFQPGWEKILAKYRITWIIYDTDSDFSRFLLHQKEWVLIYSDKVASIFVKDLPQHGELIRKYRGVTPAPYRTETEPL